jgi:hypothetical protein
MALLLLALPQLEQASAQTAVAGGGARLGSAGVSRKNPEASSLLCHSSVRLS